MADSTDQYTLEFEHQESPRPLTPSSNKKKKKKHISMHEGIGSWADCCSCEAEPYWREHAGEMGIAFNDYEEEEFEPEEPEQKPDP